MNVPLFTTALVGAIVLVDYVLVRGGSRLRDEIEINYKEKEDDGRN